MWQFCAATDICDGNISHTTELRPNYEYNILSASISSVHLKVINVLVLQKIQLEHNNFDSYYDGNVTRNLEICNMHWIPT
jgi:hypothetical protein